LADLASYFSMWCVRSHGQTETLRARRRPASLLHRLVVLCVYVSSQVTSRVKSRKLAIAARERITGKVSEREREHCRRSSRGC
jgi:hypothetical protein